MPLTTLCRQLHIILWLYEEDPAQRERAWGSFGLDKRHDYRLLPMVRRMLDQSVLKARVAEAAAALLGLDEDQPGGDATDYKAALTGEFGT
jgi:hypothetical protein